MTPDSPKGPACNCAPCRHEAAERTAPIPYLRRHVAEAIYDALKIYNRADVDVAADAIVAMVRPELERLTAELQAQNRLYRMVGTERDEKQFEIERLRRWVDRFRERAAEHLAEVSRLREQLAAQPPPDLVERAAIWLFRTKTSQMLPDVLQRANKTWNQVLDQCDRDAWIYYARQMLADLGWGVSSSEVEAPQQHKVTFESVYPGVHRAVCRTCGQDSGEGVGEYAALWRDQHEADTLVPQAEDDERVPTLEALRSQRRRYARDEGRPSGSDRLAPRPSEAAALVREFHEAFGLPINDTTRTLNKLRANLVREEGNEAADAIEEDGPESWAKELADLVIVAYGAALTLGIDLDEAVRLVHASNMSKLGPDDKPVMREDGKVLKGPNYVPPDMSSALLQDAAQAARSGATPEALAAHAKVMADQHRQFADFIEAHAPSPSLPKEGEDTPPVARRAVYAHPGYDYEYGEEGERVGINAGWDLAFGCRVSFGLDEGESYVVVSMSDRELRDGSCNRSVTREQIRGFAYYLIQMTEEMDEFLPSVSTQEEKEGETE